MSRSSLDETLKDLGSFGSRFIKELTARKIQLPQELSIQAQWLTIDKLRKKYGALVALGYNLCYCDIPIQMTLTPDEIHEVMLWIVGSRLVFKTKVKNCAVTESKYKKLFLKKDHPGALHKVNLWFTEVVESMKGEHSAFVRDVLPYIYHHMVEMRMSNDQATGIVLQFYIMYQLGYTDFSLYLALFKDQKYLKLLTTIIKSTGNNVHSFGALVCEWTSLLGRGISPVVWKEDLSHRLSVQQGNAKTVHIDENKLRDSVRYIIQLELGSNPPEIEDESTYWARRWSWCVNGAHNNVVTRELEKNRTPDDVYPNMFNLSNHLPKRIHRRVFAEEVDYWDSSMWNGISYVTTAEKLEHGKSRALYSVDTLTYFMFNRILMPVEKKWKNRRVVLDPGSRGATYMVDRVRTILNKSKLNLMLDYEDFNSQHSNMTMSIVIDELCNYLKIDVSIRDKLINSINNCYIYHKGMCQGLSRSGLHSGHRFTSFMNSVLNFVYLDCTVDNFRSANSIHVGDDVYIGTNTFKEAENIVLSVRDSTIRIQRLKQSLGTLCAEFLRTAIDPYHAIGYTARSVASLVSGNWESTKKLNPSDTIHMLLQQLWTIRNRSGISITPCVLPLAKRMYPHIANDVLISILNHRASLDGSPVRGRMSHVMSYKSINKNENEYVEHFRGYATRDYLSSCLQPIEKQILLRKGMNPINLMLDASYKKTLTKSVGSPLQENSFDIVSHKLTKVSRLGLNEDEILWSSRGAIINKYPILSLYKDILTEDDYRMITDSLGLEIPQDALEMACLGIVKRGAVVITPAPFSDINSLVNERFTSGVVSCAYLYKM